MKNKNAKWKSILIVSMLMFSVFVATLAIAAETNPSESSSTAANNGWSLDTAIYLDGTFKGVRTFGMNESATDLFDDGIDDTAPPAEMTGFDVFFSEAEASPKDRLSIDIKSLEYPKNWTLVVTSPKKNTTNVTWNTAEIPSDVYLEMEDLNTHETIDMSVQNFVTVEGGEWAADTKPFKITATSVDKTPPTTTVTQPPDITPIDSGTTLDWTNTAVMLSFRRTDPGSGVNYTNLSAETQITDVDVNGTATMTIPQVGTDNLTINTTTFGETFNVTFSDELNTKIYYYSVDKNVTANVEDTKNLTVRIDKTHPVVSSVVLNNTTPTTGDPILVTVTATDPVNGGVASGIDKVTADGVELTPQGGDIWEGTITAKFGEHNVNVSAKDEAGNYGYNDSASYNATGAATTGEIIINEIMYNPAGTESWYEWIELYNNDTNSIDVSGWVLNGTIGGTDTILSGTLGIGGYMVLAKNVSAFQARYPEATCTIITGNWSALSNSSDTINISDSTSTLINSVTYTNIASENYTIERNATGGWEESCVAGGTPCEENSVTWPVHNLYTGECFKTIQAAIDDSDTDNGDTITVNPGTYTENVAVYKQLTIRSTSGNPSDTIVEAADTDESVFNVTADYVNISGFTVTGATGWWSVGGIYLDSVEHCNISNNNASNNEAGIVLDEASNNTLTDNTVSNNLYGIELWYSSNCTLTDNAVLNSSYSGIEMGYSSNSTLTNNTVSNSWYGIELWYSSNCTLKNNTISDNWFFGILLESSNNTLTNNTFVNDGLFVWNSYDNTVVDNTVNGKPLVYREDVADQTITNAGQVVLVNCDNITAKNLDLSNASVGVELWGTNNSEIANVNSSNNYVGILLIESNSSTLMNITALNVGLGIYLEESSSNTLTNITASSGFSFWGLFAPEFYSDDSHNNVVEDFTISSYPTTISFTYDNRIEIYSVIDPEPDPVGKGNIGKYLEADGGIDAWISLNVSYEDADVTKVVNDSLRLYHWNETETEWEPILGSGVNTTENYVYANVTDFSQIAPFGTSLAPYTAEHYPAPDDTNVPIDTNITVHVKNDAAGVNESTIVMTVEGDDVTDDLVITDDPSDYTVEYDPPADFKYRQVVDVTIDAEDLSTPPNVMDTYEYSFTIGPDTAAPVIRDVQATSITRSSAAITWTTDEKSNSTVEYGTTTAYGSAKSDGELRTSHSISLTGLSSGTTYHYRVKSTDAAGNPAVSGDYTFTTKSVGRPGGGGGPPTDSDGDGYSDIQEMLAGTDKDDPCDPNPECAACLALKPAATPTPTPTVTVTPTPTIPPVVTTPTPTPTPTPTEEPGFEAVFAIAGLLAVAYLVLRRKSK